MALPTPAQLPREHDVSSQILSKLDAATYGTLNSALVSTWLNELDESIQTTKIRLLGRIQSDLPQFQRQWETAKSIQTRLQNLTDDVDFLDATVNNSKSGLIPVLLRKLVEHSQLAQEAADIQTRYQALSHVLQCKTEFSNFDELVKAGKLSEAVTVLETLHTLLQFSPEPVVRSKLFVELQRKYQSSQALVQEQLSDAYTRSIVISASQLVIRSLVHVRNSKSILSLSSILSSLSFSSLNQHLTILKRDVLTHFIESILRQPLSVSLDSFDDAGHSISLIPALPNNEDKSTRVENLSRIFSFLFSRLFPLLPASVSSSFPQSLFKPTTTALLNVLLIPSLPSSFGLLPPFIQLAKRSVVFETDLVTRLEGSSTAELPVRTWVDGLAVHYEKQRRLELLSNCRTIILSQEDSKDHFTFEIEVHSESAETNAVSVQSDMIKNAVDNSVNTLGFDNEVKRSTPAFGEKPQAQEPPSLQREEIDYQDDAWGFDNQEMPEQLLAGLEKSTLTPTDITSEDGDIGWEFDEDDNIPAESPQPDETAAPRTSEGEVKKELDSDEAWGWNDDTGAIGGDSSWDDDPWADASTVQESVIENHVAPKTASRLEKLANKAKKPVNGLPESAPSIPMALHPPSSNPQNVNGTQHPLEDIQQKSAVPARHPMEPRRDILIRERFTVSNKAKRIVKAVQNLIEECKQLQASSLFPLYPQIASSSSNQPGAILSQTSVSFVDLYIALYPVKFDKDLSQSAQKGMLFSNNCLYLAHEVEGIGKSLGRSGGFDGLKEKLEESGRNLTILSMSWYERVVQARCDKVDDLLVEGGKGFAYTSDQDRYDECEMAISQSVQEIKRFSQQIKSILTKGKYHTAIGLVTEAALFRILQDILMLSDIPEIDSHRLSELCRILNSLESLFSEDPEQPSFVVAYVPSWLKFNYLSELLEASMADISYLFEEGALVDFEIDELERLVKALFTDTALRTNIINKLLEGHPPQSS